MADNDGTLIIAPIAPKDTSDEYPSHKAVFGLGGLRSVANITARNAITTGRREEGMIVYVQDTDYFYYLKDGITDDCWHAINFSPGFVTLDDAFDNGKVINGANSLANAMRVGDGTNYVSFGAFTETSSKPTIYFSDSLGYLSTAGASGGLSFIGSDTTQASQVGIGLLTWNAGNTDTITLSLSADYTADTGSISWGGTDLNISSNGAITFDDGTNEITVAQIKSFYDDRVITWSAPLSFSSNIASIDAATTSVDGYLTSTDWNTFNGKEDVLTFNYPFVRTVDTINLGYNTTNLKITSTQINTIQNITTSSTPTFSNVISNNEATENSHLVRFDQMNSAISGLSWQKSVLDQIDFVTSEPSGPTLADRYINTVTGTSSETAQSVTANYIYEWNGVDWTEYEPSSSWTVWDVAADTNYTFNGSAWVEFGSTVSHNNTTGLQGGTSSQYYHLTNTEYGYISGVNSQSLLTIGTPTFAELTVDNININGSTITGLSDANTVLTAYTGKAIVIESVSFDGGTMSGAWSTTGTHGTIRTYADGKYIEFTADTISNGLRSAGGLTFLVDGSTNAFNVNSSRGFNFYGVSYDFHNGDMSNIGDITGVDLLTVDNITINGAAITSSTGAISFDNENLSTTGTGTFGNLSLNTNTLSNTATDLTLNSATGILKGGNGAYLNLYNSAGTNYITIRNSSTEAYISNSSGDFKIKAAEGVIIESPLDMDNEKLINLSYAGYSSEYDAGNSGSSKTIDQINGAHQYLTMTDNCSLTISFSYPGCLILRCIQDGTGSRVLSFASTVHTEEGASIVLTTTPSAVDLLLFYYNGSSVYCMPNYNMS